MEIVFQILARGSAVMALVSGGLAGCRIDAMVPESLIEQSRSTESEIQLERLRVDSRSGVGGLREFAAELPDGESSWRRLGRRPVWRYAVTQLSEGFRRRGRGDSTSTQRDRPAHSISSFHGWSEVGGQMA